jgi:two-component system LytT family response regulator
VTAIDRTRVLIVDDEPLARDCLRLPLAARNDVEIVGECGDGAAAVNRIVEDPPDLVFLDVQMPGLDGFEVVERVGADRMPSLIFVTAHGQHAVRAFEVHAINYLMKPFTTARLHAAVDHARARLRSWQDDETVASLQRMRAGERGASLTRPPASRLLVREGERFRFLSVDDVLWFEASRNQVRAHVADGSHLLSMPIGALAERLDPARFVRCHRSSIVNLDAVREVQAWFGGDYIAVLVNGAQVRVSRTHRAAMLRPIV